MDQGTQRLITRHNEQMRELIVRDIDALENKLNVKRQVSHMADGAVDKVKGTLGMNDSYRNEGWGGFVRHNAAPLLAIGLGGTVVARNLRNKMEYESTPSLSSGTTYRRYGATGYPTREPMYHDQFETDGGSSEGGGMRDKASSMASDVSDKASEHMDTAKSKVSDAAQMVGERASHVKDVVSDRIPSRGQAKQMAKDHSQLLGFAALGAGALIGALAPRTRVEEEKLAPVQSQMKDKASELVETGVEKAKDTADRAAGAISAGKEAAQEEFQDTSSQSESSDTTSSTESESALPDLTQPNRITGTRSSTPSRSGVNGGY